MVDSNLDPRLEQYARSQLPPGPFAAPSSIGASQPYYAPPNQAHQATGAPPLDPSLEDGGMGDGSPGTEDHGDEHHDGDGSKGPGDAKRPRACDSCRGLKVRCDQDPEHPEIPCKRCAKANRQCITTPPTRKRQKKADSRVAELERKIDALTASLHAQRQHGDGRPYSQDQNTPSSHYGSPYDATSPHAQRQSMHEEWSSRLQPAPLRNSSPGHDQKRRRTETTSGNPFGDTSAEALRDFDPVNIRKEVLMSGVQDYARRADAGQETKSGPKHVFQDHSDISRKIEEIMDESKAETIFQRYKSELSKYFPAVPLPSNMRSRDLRDEKPILHLAILTAASYGSAIAPPDMQRDLGKLLRDQLADSLIKNGEKSLEIVQALQVSVLWYRPPVYYEQHNFYLLTNAAAVMALDLGLGKRIGGNMSKLNMGMANVHPFRRSLPDAGSVESRRAMLVCYYLAMTITMVLRRPILLTWTKYMEDSCHFLETSPEALPSDKELCAHVRMAHVGQEIASQFHMDDPMAELSISEPKVMYALKMFENDLATLQERRPSDSHALKFAEQVINLYIHEVALHSNHNIEDFTPQYSNESLGDALASKANKQEVFGPAHIAALGDCLTASHGILDIFLGMPFEVRFALPVIFCVRAIYAQVCLIKMWVAVTGPGDMGSIIRREDLRVEHYLDNVTKVFQTIVDRDAQAPHAKFLYVSQRLKEKFHKIREGGLRPDGSAPPRAQMQGQGHPANNAAAATAQQAVSALEGQQKTQPGLSNQIQQTPLHFLSEVATGSNTNNTTATPESIATPASGPAWYDPALTSASSTQTPAPMANMQTPNIIDVGSFDMMGGAGLGSFDLGSMGVESDWSGLFAGDNIWNYNFDFNAQQGQGQAMNGGMW